MTERDRVELQRRTERWFVRRGLPHFIDHYNVVEDVFTRAAPFLYLVFILEVLAAMNLEWTWWQNTLALVAATAVVFGALAALNLHRGQPWYRRPRTVGAAELVGFVLVPTLLPIIGGAHFREALAFALGNLALLVAVYLVVGYGLIPMTIWAVGRTMREFRNLANLLVRALPLLLVFSMFMFLNAELWKVADEVPNAFLGTAIGMLVLVGSLLLVLRLPGETSEAATFASWKEVEPQLRGTPLEHESVAGLADPPPTAELTTRGRVNVGLVLFFSQAVQIVLVAMAIGLFYVLFGLFTMQIPTIEQWTGDPIGDTLATWRWFGADVVLTRQLLRSAAFVAAIAGLQFVVTALGDEAYRKEFVENLQGELRQAFAVRALYLDRVGTRHDAGPDATVAGA